MPMKYDWIDTYLLSKKGVTKDIQTDWNWIRYKLNDKMFAAICRDDNDIPYYITLKLEPMKGEIYRQQYEDISPGYYMNKVHWNSINPNGMISDDMMKDMLDESYDILLHSFSKKKQMELLGE